MADVPDFTLAGMLENNAAVRGADLALSADGTAVTFADLARRARAVASGLKSLGLRHQDRVAVLARNSVEYCEVYAGCERGGFIVATVNFRLAAKEMAHVVRDSGARILIFDTEFDALVDSIRADLPEVENYFAIGKPPAWAPSFTTLRNAEAPPDCLADDIATLIYTSGTTGKPKGCMLGQREGVEMARIIAGDTRMSSRDRILLTMPLFHIGAKCMMNAQHWVGGATVLHREFDPAAVLRAIEDERITTLHLAPTMVQMLLESPNIDRYDLSSLRAIVYSAAAMPLAVLQRGMKRFGPIFYHIYGLTEGIGTFLAPEYHLTEGSERELKRLRSIGRPSPGVAVRIGDEQSEEPVGRPGEILLRTPTATRGYWNNHAATLDTLRGGWVHTGDIGYRDDDGFIYLVDRKKDMIVSGGENIYSREVEEALYQHPDVLEAAVIGVPDPKWGEAVRAVVSLREGASVEPGELIRHVQSLIASYKKPRDIIFVEALPKTANGKIDKQTIRRLHGEARN